MRQARSFLDARFDIALSYDLDIPADIAFHELAVLPPYAVLHEDHPLAGREPFPPEALTQYPFILLEEGDDYEIQEVLDTLGVQPNVQYRVQQDQVILAMVSCGLGISIMEELMLDRNEYPVVACSFAKPFYRNIGICVKDKRAISRSTYRFVEHVRRWVLEKYSG